MASKEARIEVLQVRIRRMEEERERVTWLLEAVPVGYVVMDENGNVKEFNRRLEQMLGFPNGVPVHGPLARLIMQADVPVFLDHLRRCKSSREAVTSEIRLRNGTNRGLSVEIVSLPMRKNTNGHAHYGTAILDLTKRHVTEQKLADTLASFGTLLDTVEGIVWEVDGDTLDVTFVSRFAETMLGYPISQWFQHGFWERHIYVDDRERVMQEFSRALQEQKNVTVDYRVLTADRKLVWIHDRIGVRMQGGKIKLLGIAVDITAQKNTEAELEKERANLELRVAERTAQLQTQFQSWKLFPTAFRTTCARHSGRWRVTLSYSEIFWQKNLGPKNLITLPASWPAPNAWTT
jgi:PAS domain S-box-containing protein